MPELEPNQQSDFMIEKIKQRPINKKKLIRQTLVTAAMAVIFGLIACFTFLVLEPVLSNWLHPEEPPQIVVFPEDLEEMSPEEMLQNNMQQESQQETEPENLTLEEEQIQEILSGVTLDMDNYKQLYNAMSIYAQELNQCMVTITGITSNLDWLNNVQESRNQSSGVIVANNGKELFILADYTPLRKAERLTLTFYNGIQVNAQLKKQDLATNLAVLSVSLEGLSPEFLENNLKIAKLGSSNLRQMVGIPVVALGSPMGSSGSIGYGMISSTSGQLSVADANYKLLQTNIVGSQNAGGVLFDLQGQVIGIITNNRNSSDLKNLITAYGITDLKTRIGKMSNGEQIAYMGISGIDVTAEAHNELNIPYGAYVKEVVMDSPAMLAGVQQGDVITLMDNKSVLTFNEYSTILMQLEVGQTVKLSVMRQVQDGYKVMEFDIVPTEEK